MNARFFFAGGDGDGDGDGGSIAAASSFGDAAEEDDTLSAVDANRWSAPSRRGRARARRRAGERGAPDARSTATRARETGGRRTARSDRAGIHTIGSFSPARARE